HFKTNYSLVIGKKRNGEYLPFIPANKLTFETGFMGKKFALGSKPYLLIAINYAFAQNNIDPGETVTPDYILVNLSMGSSFRLGNQPLEVNLTVQNLLDKKYVDHLSTLKEVDLYNPGRNISLSLRIPFRASIR
ncbi:MAG TPA: TonB-dependent receptor, partial [Tenuifilum sp.]|nr:TonB-dependent receptor [Tenuifilum sp.]